MNKSNKKSDLHYSDFHNEDMRLRIVEAELISKISISCHEAYNELGLTEDQLVEYLEKFVKFYKTKLHERHKENL